MDFAVRRANRITARTQLRPVVTVTVDPATGATTAQRQKLNRPARTTATRAAITASLLEAIR